MEPERDSHFPEVAREVRREEGFGVVGGELGLGERGERLRRGELKYSSEWAVGLLRKMEEEEARGAFQSRWVERGSGRKRLRILGREGP